MTTFVSLGNACQPFPRLLEAIYGIQEKLPHPIIVQHGYTPCSYQGLEALPFVDMPTFESLIARAQVLILHAGAGATLHAIRAGKKPILVPRRACFGEHVNDHQLEFAHQLAMTGRVIFVEELQELANAVTQVHDVPSQESFPEPVLVGEITKVLADINKQLLA